MRYFPIPRPGSLVAGLALLLLTVGCSESSSGGLFGSKMSIVSTSPAGGTTDVQPATKVAVQYSAAIELDSVSSATFAVTSALNGDVTGTLRLTNDDRTIEFTADAAFADGDTITVVATDKIRGQGGSEARSVTFSFVIAGTAPPVDPPEDPIEDPPPLPPSATITFRAPAPGEVLVPVGTTVMVEFAESMDSTTFNDTTVALVGSLGGPVPSILAASELVDGGSRLNINPQRDYLPGETVSVLLSTDLMTTDGIGFRGDSFSFMTATLAGDPRTDTLAPGPTFPVTDVVVDLVSADFDSDGRLDLVTRSEVGTTLQVYMGTETGLFGSPLTLDLQQAALDILVVDEDGDGLLDVLAATIDRVHIFHQIAPTAEGDPVTFDVADFVPTGIAVYSMAAGDLDHRNIDRPDFVLDTENGIQIYRDGLDQAPSQVLGDMRLPRTSILIGSAQYVSEGLEMDGWPEIIYGDSTGNRIAIHPFVAEDDRFADTPITVALPSDALETHLVDVDLDTYPDLIALVGLPDGTEAIFVVLDSHTTEPIGDAMLLPNLGTSRLHFGDLLGTGYPDALISNSETATLSFKENLDGILDLQTDFDAVLTGVTVHAVAAQDFTGDAIPDLVISAGDHLMTLLSSIEAPPAPPVNHLTVSNAEGPPGDTSIPVTVDLSNESDLDAFTLVVGFDGSALAATGVEISGTATFDQDPDFTSEDIANDENHLVFQVTFDVDPLEGKMLAAGTDQSLLRVVFDVLPTATPGTVTVSILDTSPDSAADSLLMAAGEYVPFTSDTGTFTILEPPPPPPALNNSLDVGDVDAGQGDTNVLIPVFLTNEIQIDGYNIILGFDNTVLEITGMDLAGTVTEGVQILDGTGMMDINNELGYVAYSAILMPAPGNTILPGTDQLLVHVTANVLSDATTGPSTVAVLDTLEGTLLNTMLISLGLTHPANLSDGSLNISEVIPEPTNTLGLTDVSALQGDTGLVLEARLTNESPVDLLTAVIGFDPTVIDVDTIDTGLQTTTQSFAMFHTETIDQANGYLTYDVLFFEDTFGGASLPPEAEQTLFRVGFSIDPLATVGTHTVELLATSPDDLFHTRLISAGTPLTLESSPATITVGEGLPVENPNDLVVTSLTTPAGSSGVLVPILLTNVETVVGFTVVGTYDAAAMDLNDFAIAGTVIESMAPDFASSEILPESSSFNYSVLLDLFPPIEDKSILPGVDAPILQLVFDVPVATPAGDYPIELRNDLGTFENLLVREDGISLFPDRTDGILSVTDAPPAPVFLRGDVNGSGTLDISDQSFLTLYLNGASPPPGCLDAADVDDSGTLDNDDVLYLLNYLFNASSPPPAPFPEIGPDPTPDGIDCAESQ